MEKADIFKEISKSIHDEYPYFSDVKMKNLMKEAHDYYTLCCGNKSLFKSSQALYIQYYTKRSTSERLAPMFYELVLIERKEEGLFLY